MKKLLISLFILILSINYISFGFDNQKNGWYINTDVGIEKIYLKEQIYDSTLKKTVSKSANKNGLVLDIGFGYIFKDNAILGLGLYFASIGDKPHLITNIENNQYFDINETGNYIIAGYNFKKNHFFRFSFLTSSITGNKKFIKDSKYFDGTGYNIQYSYEIRNHMLLSIYFRTNSFVNENEWSDKIDIGSFGFKIGWLFY